MMRVKVNTVDFQNSKLKIINSDNVFIASTTSITNSIKKIKSSI